MPHNPPPRVEKICLAGRKSIREDWDANAPNLRKQMCECLGVDSFQFIVDIPQLYAYAKEFPYSGRTNIGWVLFTYFENFTNRVSVFTDNGKDTDSVTMFRSAVYKNEATLVAGDFEPVFYNKTEIRDGMLYLYFNPEELGTAMDDVAEDLRDVSDAYLESKGEIPITTKRVVTTTLDPLIAGSKEKLKELFRRPIDISYNISECLASVRAAHMEKKLNRAYFPNLHGWRGKVPYLVGRYIQETCDTLESLKFGTDELLRDAWLRKAGDKGILFELMDTLPTGLTSNVTFADGYFKIQVLPESLTSGAYQVAHIVLDKL